MAPRCPWQNPFVERVIGSLRRECSAITSAIVVNPDGSIDATKSKLSIDLALLEDARQRVARDARPRGRDVPSRARRARHHRENSGTGALRT